MLKKKRKNIQRTGKGSARMTLNKQRVMVDDKIEELSQNRAKRHRKGKHKTIVA